MRVKFSEGVQEPVPLKPRIPLDATSRLSRILLWTEDPGNKKKSVSVNPFFCCGVLLKPPLFLPTFVILRANALKVTPKINSSVEARGAKGKGEKPA